MTFNDADRLDLPTVGPDGLDRGWDEIREIGGHFDRAGNAISLRDWCRLREFGGIEYIVVKQEHIGPYWVSTVWLGINHRFGDGPPLIFETMVFKGKDSDLDCRRYSTEEDAIEGHERVAEEVRLTASLEE